MSAKSLVLSVAVLVGLTSSVSAQDAFTWTGAYVGVQAGYGWGDADLKNYVPGLSTQSTPHPDGVLGGVYVGYSHHFQNNLVAGLEADMVLSGADSGFETALDRQGNPFPPNQDATDVDYSAGLRVRVGYAIDRFLPYVSGGLAVAHANFT